jgi:hypothetical protein
MTSLQSVRLLVKLSKCPLFTVRISPSATADDLYGAVRANARYRRAPRPALLSLDGETFRPGQYALNDIGVRKGSLVCDVPKRLCVVFVV